MECKQLKIWVHVGDRVKLSPYASFWAKGYDRGIVTRLTNKYVYVLLDGLDQPKRLNDYHIDVVLR